MKIKVLSAILLVFLCTCCIAACGKNTEDISTASDRTSETVCEANETTEKYVDSEVTVDSEEAGGFTAKEQGGNEDSISYSDLINNK